MPEEKNPPSRPQTPNPPSIPEKGNGYFEKGNTLPVYQTPPPPPPPPPPANKD
ncbi:hypothetical protein [Ferruginibacter profundus]